MVNRKFDVKRDFHELVELEHTIMPIIRGIKNEDQKIILMDYVRKIFDNQFKK